jgi:hypothetical protein
MNDISYTRSAREKYHGGGKEARVLSKLLAIIDEETRKPFPVGPFTERFARAWHWYYEVLFRHERGEMMGARARSLQQGYDELVGLRPGAHQRNHSRGLKQFTVKDLV